MGECTTGRARDCRGHPVLPGVTLAARLALFSGSAVTRVCCS